MHPAIVIDWGPVHVAVSAYRLALATAAFVACGGVALAAIGRGLPRRRVAATVSVAALGAVAGARIVGSVDTGTPLFALSIGAFSIWGAMAGGLAAGALAWRPWRRSHMPAGMLLDAAAIPAGLAIGIARTGCLCAGCCFGLPTHVPWGVTYPPGSNAHVANLSSSHLLDTLFAGSPPVHPIPVYDGGAALAAAGVAWWVHRRLVLTGRARPGSGGAAFIATYGLARAVVEHFRFHPPDPGLLGPGAWQLVFATIALGSITWLLRGLGYQVANGTVEAMHSPPACKPCL